jgi:DNA-binding protein HU-beta
MTKEDLVNEIGKALKNREQAEAALNSFLNNITDTLRAGDSVTLTGFGTFKVINRKARKGRNPQTGEVIQIEAKRVPKFTVGKKLAEAIQ